MQQTTAGGPGRDIPGDEGQEDSGPEGGPGRDVGRRARVQSTARIVLTIGLVAAGLWIASSFIHALIWGVIITIAVVPIYVRAEARWPTRTRVVLPATVTFAIALLVLVPLAAGVFQAAREAHQLTSWLAVARHDGVPLPQWAAQLPVGREVVTNWWNDALATPDAASSLLDRLNGEAMARSRLFGTDLVRRLVAFAFALLTLFFLLRDRHAITAQAQAAGHRLFGASGERVAEQVLLSVRGTINGLVLVGIGEGAVLAVAYFAFDVPHPLMLGALTAVAAMIPLGAVVLFGIAALLLMAQGAVGGAVAVFVIGLVVTGLADHLIRPALIGGTTRLPFLWVLVGILGGVETLGLLGLFVGPATMAVLIMLWREFVAGSDLPVAAGA
ncbi:MAG: AI-2E family transporter [Janthinobacterium lividum]